MVNDKSSRHTAALLTFVLASALLYPTTEAGLTGFIWVCIGLTSLATILTLVTK